jgi:Ran GTPase-activating protein (RanGAP) involved in mRNA processing and transport
LKVHSSLTSLDLSDNAIKQDGAMAIADALKVNSCLTSLDLSNNAIKQDGAMAIADALKVNSCLTSLDLSNNAIEQERAMAIADALQVNISLTSLNLCSNCTYFDEFIVNALMCNPTLLHLTMLGKDCHALQGFVSTCHHLEGLLEILIGKDGAHVLRIVFCITSCYLSF